MFRTLLADCSQVFIPVINVAFKENYLPDATILPEANERFLNRQNGGQEERVTDSAFYIKEQPDKWYHIECQSTADHTMVIRMFEYDSPVALHHRELEDGVLTVKFPESAIIFLRHNSRMPEAMKIRILTRGGELSYDIPTIKVQNYPLDAIFEKKLLFSIPFYIFRYEKEFPEMEQNDEKRQRLEEDYVRIQKKLTELCEAEVQEIHGLKV